MGPVASALRLLRTVRHLRWRQIIGRVRFRLSRPLPDPRPAPATRTAPRHWVQGCGRPPSLVAPGRFVLLNECRDLGDVGWDGPGVTHLWRYNQHYFEDLVADDAAARAAWHRSLIHDWIACNPPGRGTGWEPYPTSLRIVNWIKWSWQGGTLSEEATHSLAMQVRWLTRRLEWHLLGNHLFVNAKALVFAGLHFEGSESRTWLRRGLDILREQVTEQILPDGGQFELSPMYHALALEDMLDLWNAIRARSDSLEADDLAWIDAQRSTIETMRRWLDTMMHPDGDIALVNDAAFGIAPARAALHRYAKSLGFAPALSPADGLTVLADSGYVRVQLAGMVTILDVGRIGPDYLPGYAHADTLSVELSLHGHRVLVDSGTSEYGTGAERLRQRGTAAHNTLTVDGADSSEVWGGFRVARRARPLDLRIERGPDGRSFRIACGHNGFLRLRGGAVHRKTWTFAAGSLEVLDEVTGTGRLASFWHWHPSCRVSVIHDTGLSVRGTPDVTVDVAGGVWNLEPSTWHPRFGVRQEACRGSVTPSGRTIQVRFRWSDRASSLPD